MVNTLVAALVVFVVGIVVVGYLTNRWLARRSAPVRRRRESKGARRPRHDE